MNAWKPAPTTFTPSDMGLSTRARGFARTVGELDPSVHGALGDLGPIPTRATGGDVVVTGSAGFLGARVVRDLLARPGPARIHVCSRNPLALARVMERMVGRDEAARLMADERLVAMPIDLTDADASDAMARHIAGVPVSTVVHLAAAVDAFAPRERLRAANETATRSVVTFAAAAGARLVHASTLSVFVSSDMDGEADETSLRGRPDRTLLGGYAQTKAVADMLVEDAATQGLDACSLRLGLLVPEGGEQMDVGSFLSTFRDALALVGCVPASAEEALVDLTPVDQAAACIVALIDATHVPTFVHYANTRSAPLSMLVELMLGPDPIVVDDADWEAEIAKEASIPAALLDAAFRKSRFLSERCERRPVANADLFQSTGRRYDVSTAIALGAPEPRPPEIVAEALFGEML